MKNILFLLLFSVSLFALEPITITVTSSHKSEPEKVEEAEKTSSNGRKMLIMISSGALEKAGMGYALGLSATSKGISTTIVIGAKALSSAMVKGKQNIFLAKGLTHREILQKAIEKGANVLVCGMCAKALGVGENDFIKGVKIVKSADIFDRMYEEGVKVLSF